MTNNPDQPIFDDKQMVVDKKGQVVPQYYDRTAQAFHPNTGGQPMAASYSNPSNPFQPDLNDKMMLVDKKGRPIPQYYNPTDGFFYPITTDQSGGGGGGGGTSGVLTVNLRSPDANGNVNTDFKIIDAIAPDIPPTDYPGGATEFYTEYDPAAYSRYIDDNPTMRSLEKGQICVRTFKEPGLVYQQIDNVRNGVFDAAYVRISEDGLTWGPLSGLTKINVIDNLTSTDEKAALSAKQGNVIRTWVNGVQNTLDAHIDEKASTTQLGHVKVDGVTITSNDGVISAVGGGGGTPGPPGPQGIAGKDGATWYSGSGTPTSNNIVGSVGDKYLEYGNGLVWTKGANGWYFERDGTIRGNKWDIWEDNPTVTTDPLNGDLSLKTDGTVMEFSSSSNTWVDTGVNLKGPKGDPGGGGVDMNVIKINEEDFLDPRLMSSGFYHVERKSQDTVFPLNSFVCYVDLRTEYHGDGTIDKNLFLYSLDYSSNLPTDPYFSILWQQQKVDTNNQTVIKDVTVDGWRDVNSANSWHDFVTNLQSDFLRHTIKTASDSDLGHVKVDGDTITIYNGVISADFNPLNTAINQAQSKADSAYNLASIVDSGLISHAAQKASDLKDGHVQVDGTTITSNNGLISANLEPLQNQINMVDNEQNQTAGQLYYHETRMASATQYGHVRVDNTSITATNGIISATIPPAPVVVNNLNSDSSTEVLAAAQGKALKNLYDSISGTVSTALSSISNHTQEINQIEFDLSVHEGTKASPTVLGHVKIDDETIKIDSDGVISATVKVSDLPIASTTQKGIVQLSDDPSLLQPDMAPTHAMMVNHMMQEATPTALGHVMKAGSVDDGLNHVPSNAAVKTAISDHASTRASTSDYGHVRVDGSTIISTDGQISAVPSATINGDTRPMKMWAGTTTVTGGEGNWSINFTGANFTQIRSIQLTLESAVTTAADKPIGTYIVSRSLTGCNGKAYKATSAGLLAAMQQLAADDGTTIHVLVIGH